ncbi:MAG TPA: hypothetical protein VN327_02225 [Pseudonocardiaceae bacterium]|jgi:hypothetical protein|nr:hypothetical protein [Pseudonocardiaceae bacterium]
MLKFFEQEARFLAAKTYRGRLWSLWPGRSRSARVLFGEYRWSGSTIEYHRGQIREFHGFREPTVAAPRADNDQVVAFMPPYL